MNGPLLRLLLHGQWKFMYTQTQVLTCKFPHKSKPFNSVLFILSRTQQLLASAQPTPANLAILHTSNLFHAAAVKTIQISDVEIMMLFWRGFANQFYLRRATYQLSGQQLTSIKISFSLIISDMTKKKWQPNCISHIANGVNCFQGMLCALTLILSLLLACADSECGERDCSFGDSSSGWFCSPYTKNETGLFVVKQRNSSFTVIWEAKRIL